MNCSGTLTHERQQVLPLIHLVLLFRLRDLPLLLLDELASNSADDRLTLGYEVPGLTRLHDTTLALDPA